MWTRSGFKGPYGSNREHVRKVQVTILLMHTLLNRGIVEKDEFSQISQNDWETEYP